MTIEAKVIADSIANGIRLTTMELKFHRFILPEFNTHRMFSRNASSSRAIPVEKMLKQVEENPAMPIHWGKNQPGMQANKECNNKVNLKVCAGEYLNTREEVWNNAAFWARNHAKALSDAGYHKQVVNRLLEPFQYIKVIVTATEYTNFFNLRLHPDAQPEMKQLAVVMQAAMNGSTPTKLEHGE